jgi:hypothetical protein
VGNGALCDESCQTPNKQGLLCLNACGVRVENSGGNFGRLMYVQIKWQFYVFTGFLRGMDACYNADIVSSGG